VEYTAPITPPQVLTADNIVALNLRLFRTIAGLTMKQVGQRLGNYTGKRYTPQSIAYWEQSAGKEKARACSVQELVSLSIILLVPVATLVTAPDDKQWRDRSVWGGEGEGADWLYKTFTRCRKLSDAYNADVQSAVDSASSSRLRMFALSTGWTLADSYRELS
jgi:hypothetical protein